MGIEPGPHSLSTLLPDRSPRTFNTSAYSGGIWGSGKRDLVLSSAAGTDIYCIHPAGRYVLALLHSGRVYLGWDARCGIFTWVPACDRDRQHPAWRESCPDCYTVLTPVRGRYGLCRNTRLARF